jgi:hypothetical protein
MTKVIGWWSLPRRSSIPTCSRPTRQAVGHREFLPGGLGGKRADSRRPHRGAALIMSASATADFPIVPGFVVQAIVFGGSRPYPSSPPMRALSS